MQLAGCDSKWLMKVAIISRLAFLLLASLVNLAFEDFDSSTRICPEDLSQHNTSTMNRTITNHLLNGLNKWDSVYFNHITRHGYEYEQMLAFGPAFPYLVHFLSRTFMLSDDDLETFQLTGILINSIFHIFAVFLLQQLTKTLLLSSPAKPATRDSFVVITTLAFIFNPANIFMTSSYTETMFVVVQFTICLALECDYFKVAVLAVGISPLIRSNGLLNIIFFIYFYTKHIFISHRLDHLENIAECLRLSRLPYILKSTYKQLVLLLVLVFISITPYLLWQYHIHNTFCTIERIASTDNHWCNKLIPVSYGYVQSLYWNVGFLRYFQVSQIPNFLLATPICLLVSMGVIQIAKTETFTSVVKWLGYKDVVQTRENFTILNPGRTFVYVCHILFLTVFGVFNVHVQILTRMLCSSSPFVYWTVAELLLTKNISPRLKKIKFVYFVFTYFILYNILGLFLHTNFYPWT